MEEAEILASNARDLELAKKAGQIFHFIRNAHGSAILVFDSRRLFGLLLRQGRINSPGTAQIKNLGDDILNIVKYNL